MIIEIIKTRDIKEALKAGLYTVWTIDKIKGAFQFGHGTIADLQRYIDDNKTLATFIETEDY